MKIHWMEFENYTSEQKIERINFDTLNLLVGESGAGKTQVLKTLSLYVSVVYTENVIPFAGRFQMEFTTYPYINKDNVGYDTYNWEIQTDDTQLESVSAYAKKFFIKNEVLKKNETVIIERDSNKLIYRGKEIPLIQPSLSALYVFSRTDEIFNIHVNMMHFISYNHQINSLNPIQKIQMDAARGIIKKQANGDFSQINIFTNFPLAIMDFNKNYFRDVHDEFMANLQEIFPSIEDIKIDLTEEQEVYRLFIKQYNKWIPDDAISSGIIKTMYIIAMVEYCKGTSVILLDELENSLGINCLDAITDYICRKSEESEIQFILTSHHPYIINNIPEKNWLIMSQCDGVISSNSAADVGIDSSWNKQDKFFQLMNYMTRRAL